jgi:cytochrome c-type biogenesis protein CcmH/NrfG
MGEWVLARDVLRARLRDAARDPIALYDLGVVEANMGDGDAAVALWERAAAAAPDAQLRARIEESLARIRGADAPGPATPP